MRVPIDPLLAAMRPRLVALGVLALCGRCAVVVAGEPGPNLVRDPGFEQGGPGWQLPAGYRVVEGEGRSGGRCLRVESDDPRRYLLARQEVAFERGLRYRYSAWVKTRGVRGAESGATLCMEWTGARGWIGGDYIEGRKGDTDWVHLEGCTAPIPAEATGVDLKLYLRKGMTGVAWFDDVRLEIAWPEPLEVALLRPNYRGWIFPGSRDQRVIVRATVADRLPGPTDPGATRLTCEILRGAGEIAGSREIVAPAPGARDIELDASRLAPGDATVRVALRGPGGRVIGSREFALRKWGGEPLPRVHIDAVSRTVVDGRPFFPLGLYFGPGPASADFRSHIARVSASPFNVIMCYGINSGGEEKIRAYLDELHAAGLKLIYSIKDVYEGTKHHHAPVLGERGEEAIVRAVVGRFRGHPAVLGWYLNDELPLSMHDRLAARQELVRRLDPDHPTWAVLYQVDQLAGYLDTADVLGTDPYPVPSKPVALAADWARKTDAAGGGHRPVWMVPQAFDWSHYHADRPGRFPTRAELRVMTYLCLIHGADGLVYYCYHDLLRDRASFDENWARLVAVAREVREMGPALLSSEPPRPPDARVIAPESEPFHRAIRVADDGRIHVLMANPDPSKPARARLGERGGARIRLVQDGEERAFEPGTPLQLGPMSAAVAVFEAPR